MVYLVITGYLSVGEDLAKGAAESPEKARKFMNTS